MARYGHPNDEDNAIYVINMQQVTDKFQGTYSWTSIVYSFIVTSMVSFPLMQ